jgi:DnaK suppressor protein
MTILRGLLGGPPAGHLGVQDVSTANAAVKPLTKKELKRFQELLEEKRREILERARKTLSEGMTLDTDDLADEMDLASSEYLQSFEFRLRGREKSLLAKLDLAMRKIEDGRFGICEVCEEQIGKKRLEARPETSLCIRCKEDQERDEREFG